MSEEANTAARELAQQGIEIVARNKWAAHVALFRHRHSVAAAPFHKELVDEFWSADRYSQVLGFRGSAKSTIGEEDIALSVWLRAFRNIIIIGASETRAAERLRAVRYELDNNEAAQQLFGYARVKGNTWTDTKLVTPWCCVQAMGRDQDIRGIKHLDWRPDFIFVDDFEDRDSVQTPDGRAKTLHWFLAELLPACAPQRKVRVRATPMDAESVPMLLKDKSKWPTKRYPIEYKGPDGERVASWPGLGAYPLDWIDRERRNYIALGRMDVWNREFMVEAVSDSARRFRREMIRVVPRVRTWEATYAMYDPARSTGAASATTGMVVWSWLKNRLVVWQSSAERWLPSQIIDSLFAVNEEFGPVWIGFEEDGLNQWALEPIRHEMIRRGVVLPLRPMKAPRDKHGFISGLQPYFMNGEVEFATPQPDLEAQLLSFPTGEIDAPNALAYAIPMRPGLPVYEGFTLGHVAETALAYRQSPFYLAFNASRSLTVAALVQYAQGRLTILADYVREGEPATTVKDIVREASLVCRAQVKPVCGPQHWEQYNNVGLVQSLRKIPIEVDRGTVPGRGREFLRDELGQLTRGEPSVQIGRAAATTLNALAGGYCRMPGRDGRLSVDPDEGIYRTLMEGIESCLGTMAMMAGVDEDTNVAYTASGVRYRRYATAHGRA